MMTEQDWERLARYVTGEASPDERVEVERWVAASADHRAILTVAERRWAAAAPRHERSVDAAWARLASKLARAFVDVDDDDLVPLAPRRARWSVAAGLLPLAATILIAVGVVAIWRARSGPEATDSLGAPLAAAAETRTGVGERRTIDLPDGSQISLGAASTLRVGERFGEGERRVYLEGVARFRVRHDSLRPFVVHAAGTVTEDLGTEFDVRAYRGDSIVLVVVSEGAVAVRRDQAAGDTLVTLRPGDVARVGPVGQAAVLRGQNLERLMAWESGEIVFDNAPLSEVAKELERWFDIECRIADSALERKPLTGRYRSDSLDEVLRVIGMATDVRAERRGRVVTFTRGSVPRALETPPSGPRRAEAGV